MEKMESQSSNSLRNPIRRRSHSRKLTQGSVINMAEARREIAHALHLHRSTSSSSSTSTKTPSSYVAQEISEPNWMVGNSNNHSTKKHGTLATSYCCYSLVEAIPMPLPEPVWSTTAPAVPAAPPAPGMEALEFFEWGENHSSSYTWWLGFLRALDGNNIEKTKHPFVKEDSLGGLERQEISSILGDATNFVDASDQINASLDEWLMFPTTEDDSL